jgi:PAS domain S-box-containing protein
VLTRWRWSQRAVITLSMRDRYLIAVAAAVAGTSLRWVLNPLWSSNELPFITFFPAVMVSAWLGGLGPGLVTTLLTAIIADYFWIEPSHTLAIHDLSDGVALLFYVGMGAIISLLNELWRRTAIEFKRSEERLGTTLASIGDGVIATDREGRITRLNRVAEHLTGWTEMEALGRPIAEVFVIINEQSRRPAENPVARVIRDGLTSGLANHTLLISRQGREIQIDDSAAPIRTSDGQTDGVVVVFRDITEKRRVEAERAARLNDRHTIVLSHGERLARMGSWRWEPDTNTLRWSAELYRIYGVDPATPLSFETFMERVLPDDRPQVQQTIRAALETRRPFHFTERIMRPDGQMRVLDSQGDVEIEGGRLVALFGFCRDITDDIRKEEALQEQEERFAKMFQSSPAASVLTAARDGRFLDVNTRFLELTGYAREELIGRTAQTVGLWTPAERDELLKKLRDRGALREVQVSYRTKSGQRRQALASIERITIGGEDCLLKLFWRT